MKKKILIIGAGGHGRVSAAIFTQDSRYEFSGFLDRDVSLPGVIGSSDTYRTYLHSHSFFIAIGDGVIRSDIFTNMKKNGAKFVNAIHKTAVVEPGVELGENIFLGAFSYINVGTRLGDTVYINNKCLIEHDNRIANHAHLAPGVITGGAVVVGAYSFVGLGSVINDQITIGERTIIGSGSVVIDDVPSDALAVGVPAIVKKLHGRRVGAREGKKGKR